MTNGSNARTGKIAVFMGMALVFLALSLVVYGGLRSSRNSQRLSATLEELSAVVAEVEPLDGYVSPVDGAMDAVTLSDGTDYLGILSLPALGVEVPVSSGWAEGSVLPGRYSGSVWDGTLVIAGSASTDQFGLLWDLATVGDSVTFRDVDGHSFDFRVEKIFRVGGDEADLVLSSGYDLTLFTEAEDSLGGYVVVGCDLR